jgi:hypothetical protein
MVTTYCLFEPFQILKCKLIPLSLHLITYPPSLSVCFFVFDQDKHGYFETDELKLLMNILHKVEKNDTVKVFPIPWPSPGLLTVLLSC